MTEPRKRMDAIAAFLDATDAAHGRQDSIANFLSNLGDPLVDSGAAGRPTIATRLKPFELDILYMTSDLGGIIVDEIVDEAFREGYHIAVDDETDTTDPCGEWTKELAIPETIARACKWGRLYGDGFVFVVLDDGMDPAVPVDLNRIQGITSLVDLDRWEVQPMRWQRDITKPHFGEPDQYMITPQSEGGTVEGLNAENLVHSSRMLRFTGTELPRLLRSKNFGFNDSVLQRPWDAIRRFVEVEQGMAHIVQSFEVWEIGIANLTKALQEDDGYDLVYERMKLFAKSVSMINAFILDIDGGETMRKHSSNVSGLADMRDRFAESVSKAARMPQTVLFGTAPSGLNTDGESSIQAWHKRIKSLQTKSLEPQIEWLYQMLFAAKNGPTNGQAPTGWQVLWHPLDEPGEKEHADTRFVTAQTDAIYLDRGVRSPDQVSRSRDGAAGWSMETVAQLDDDDELEL